MINKPAVGEKLGLPVFETTHAPDCRESTTPVADPISAYSLFGDGSWIPGMVWAIILRIVVRSRLTVVGESH